MVRLKDMEIEIFHFNNYVKNKDDSSKLDIIGIKHIAFRVDNVEKKYQELKSKGVDTSEPKKGTTCSKFCFLKDPDGISIELIEK
jgi:glyoxylase I family protein